MKYLQNEQSNLSKAKCIAKKFNIKFQGKRLPEYYGIDDEIEFIFFTHDNIISAYKILSDYEDIRKYIPGGVEDYYNSLFNENDKNFMYWAIFNGGKHCHPLVRDL